MSNIVVPTADSGRSVTERRRFRWPLWLAVLIVVGLFFSILVPTMCAPRETAQRIKCSSNLRQLGMAMQTYAAAHEGMLPVDWAELARAGDLSADVFICPTSSVDDRQNDVPDVEVWSKTLDDPTAHHCSYLYAGRGLKSVDLKPDDIVAFESDTDHAGDGTNLLFADGHVDWQNAQTTDKPAYERLLADYAAGIRPLRWKTQP